MAIKRIQVRNFKSLQNCELDLKALNVLVGPNSSGKSSIIQVLKLLAHAAQAEVPGADLPLNGPTFKFGDFHQIRSRFLFETDGAVVGEASTGVQGAMGDGSGTAGTTPFRGDEVVLGVATESVVFSDRWNRARPRHRQQRIQSSAVELRLAGSEAGFDGTAGSATIAELELSGPNVVRVGRNPSPPREFQESPASYQFRRLAVEDKQRLLDTWSESIREDERRLAADSRADSGHSWDLFRAVAEIPASVLSSPLYKLVDPGTDSSDTFEVQGTYATLQGCVPHDLFTVSSPTPAQLDEFIHLRLRKFAEFKRREFDSEKREDERAELFALQALADRYAADVVSPLTADSDREVDVDDLVAVDADSWATLVQRVMASFYEHVVGSSAVTGFGFAGALVRVLRSGSEQLDIDRLESVVRRLKLDCHEELREAQGLWWRVVSGNGFGRRNGPGDRNGLIHDIGSGWKSTLGQVAYMSGLRNEPRPIDDYRDTSLSLAPLGTKGEYASAVLLDEADREIECPIPTSVGFELERMSLRDGVAFWLSRFGIASASESNPLENIGVRTKLVDAQTGFALDLTYLGVGASQLLPIIVLCLRAERGDIVLLEQPEIHLHPGAQQVLGDFLLGVGARGTQLVVETHSEYLVNRLRLRMIETGLESSSRMEDKRQSVIAADQIAIWFCERHDGLTTVSELELTPDGSFTVWPEGFFDQGPLEAERILMAAMARLGERQGRHPGPGV